MTNCYVDHFTYLRSPSGLESASLLGNSMRLSGVLTAGGTTLNVTPALTVQLNPNDRVTIFDGPNSEVVVVGTQALVGATSISIQSPGLQFGHAQNTPLCSDGVLGSLADVLVDASAWMEEDLTYQSLFQQTYTGEVLPLPSMQASITNRNSLLFRPKHFPVTSLQSITMQAVQNAVTTFDATQAFIDANQQIVKVPVLSGSGSQGQVFWPQQPMNRTAEQWLTISYTAGYTPANLPSGVREIVILLTSAILSRRQNPTGADSIDFADKKLTAVLRGDLTGEGLLVKEARRKAARYKVRAI